MLQEVFRSLRCRRSCRSRRVQTSEPIVYDLNYDCQCRIYFLYHLINVYGYIYIYIIGLYRFVWLYVYKVCRFVFTLSGQPAIMFHCWPNNTEDDQRCVKTSHPGVIPLTSSFDFLVGVPTSHQLFIVTAQSHQQKILQSTEI